MESNFEQLGILQLHWDKVVNLVHSEPNIQSFYHFISSVHHGNGRYFLGLLHRQQHVFLVLWHSQHGMLFS